MDGRRARTAKREAEGPRAHDGDPKPKPRARARRDYHKGFLMFVVLFRGVVGGTWNARGLICDL
eukprot:scaffold293421_cov22-Tisochrysis_lutea.AAC.2